jgi:hypothetical protein
VSRSTRWASSIAFVGRNSTAVHRPCQRSARGADTQSRERDAGRDGDDDVAGGRAVPGVVRGAEDEGDDAGDGPGPQAVGDQRHGHEHEEPADERVEDEPPQVAPAVAVAVVAVFVAGVPAVGLSAPRNAFGFAVVLVAGILAMFGIGPFMASVIPSQRAAQGIMWLVFAPSAFLAGVYVPVHFLPG